MRPLPLGYIGYSMRMLLLFGGHPLEGCVIRTAQFRGVVRLSQALAQPMRAFRPLKNIVVAKDIPFPTQIHHLWRGRLLDV